MSDGPVGSLEKPREESSFILLLAADVKVWADRGYAEELRRRGKLAFHFGSYGWCEVRLS